MKRESFGDRFDAWLERQPPGVTVVLMCLVGSGLVILLCSLGGR